MTRKTAHFTGTKAGVSRWLTTGWSYSPWLFALALVACYSISVYVRHQQYVTWQQKPRAYFVGERPMMTTLDAPYWLRWAREYNEGVYGKDTLRSYPGNSKEFQEKTKAKIPARFHEPRLPDGGAQKENPRYRDVPLLSFLIAKLTPFFTGNYYLVGTLLIPWLASLFIIPLGIYFYRVGFPSAGLLGGLVTTFCSEYYTRSSIGRIDTDMLNLFFPSLGAMLILLTVQAKSAQKTLLYAAFSGLSFYAFVWWYGKPGFTLAFFVVLIAGLVLRGDRLRIILTASMLFILFAFPAHFISGTGSITGFLENYWVFEDTAKQAVQDNGTNPATFPNVFQTISEASKVPKSLVFQQVLTHPALGWTGFIGFAAFAFFHWRSLVPLLPILALGLLGFHSSRRFIMYLAPFIGIGLGYLLVLVFNFVLESAKQFTSPETNSKQKNVPVKKKKKNRGSAAAEKRSTNGTAPEVQKNTILHLLKKPWVREVVVYGITGVFFLVISTQTAVSFVPAPSIPTPLYATFNKVRRRVPPDSALLTWWDFGYALTDATGLATFHDGGSQFSPKTYFIARGLISHDPRELFNLTRFLATEGNSGIADNKSSPEKLLAAVNNPADIPWDPIYLFFTADMIGKYGAFSRIGSWDLEKGGSNPKGYQNLRCQKIVNEKLECGPTVIDLKSGRINKRLPLKRVVQIMRGQVVGQKPYPHSNGYTLQIVMANPRQFSEVQLVEEDVFRSNFNQMFLLGRYDRNLYEETMNAFPMSRLYRFKFPATGDK